MVVGVVVGACPMLNVPARMAAFNLDRRVPDGKAIAEPALEAADDVLGVAERAFPDHDMAAERNLLRGQRPDV